MRSPYFISSYNSVVTNRMFIFPYAGGSASAFSKWQNKFPNTEILAGQYPGRETRIKETPISNMEILVEELFHNIQPIIEDKMPYYLLGHSLGTKVAYELALRIQKSNCLQPCGLIVAAGKAPCLKENNPIHALEDEEFMRGLSRFSATPNALLNSKQLMAMFLPMLRADFKLDETYVRPEIAPIHMPIFALMGTEDTELTIDELLLWEKYTTNIFSYQYVSGAHMFITNNQEEVISILKEHLKL